MRQLRYGSETLPNVKKEQDIYASYWCSKVFNNLKRQSTYHKKQKNF